MRIILDEAIASGGGRTFELPFRPLVESWNRSDHPAQVALREYREAIEALAEPALRELEPPLAVHFHAAGRSDIAHGCDLDNFLTPVLRALGGGAMFSLVWATRGSADQRAAITLMRSANVRVDAAAAERVRARLTASATHPGWKEAVAAAVGFHDSASGSARMAVGLRFGVSPERNWVTLWKPAIDALGGILGESSRAWHPRDDRICLLILERDLRPELGWDVELDIRWAALEEATRRGSIQR